MAAVTLVTYGAQSRIGSSTPVDTSASAQLRLDLTIDVNHGKGPVVDFAIDTGPSATGPWTEVYTLKLDARQPPSSPLAWPAAPKRILLGNIDLFSRARWSATATKNAPDAEPNLSLGLVGTDA